MFNWRIALITGGSVAACWITMKYLTTAINSPGRRKRRTVNEVLLFGRDGKNETQNECVMCKIREAEYSIDVCLPRLTNESLAKCFIDVKDKRGKSRQVRVIIHEEQVESNPLMSKLIECGIEVRIGTDIDKKCRYEFIIVDAKMQGLLLMGALDQPLRETGFELNNAIITSEPYSVKEFSLEFERLWACLFD